MKIFCSIMLTVLWLAGCANPAHVHQMLGKNGGEFTSGELVHDHDQGTHNRLVLETQDRRYEAHDFPIQRHVRWEELRKRYYTSQPTHWERIFSGLDADHTIYSIETTAKSADGHELQCRLVWEFGKKPAGVCTDEAGTALPVGFE